MLILPLFLNDLGGSEILLILMVVLMFFGSKSIPSIAKTLGRTLYEFRNATSELQNEIKKSGFDIKNDLKMENILKDSTDEIIQPMDQVFSDIENTVHYGSNTPKEIISQPELAAENQLIEEKVSNSEIEAEKSISENNKTSEL